METKQPNQPTSSEELDLEEFKYSLVLDLRMKETQQEIVMHFMQMLRQTLQKA